MMKPKPGGGMRDFKSLIWTLFYYMSCACHFPISHEQECNNSSGLLTCTLGFCGECALVRNITRFILLGFQRLLSFAFTFCNQNCPYNEEDNSQNCYHYRHSKRNLSVSLEPLRRLFSRNSFHLDFVTVQSRGQRLFCFMVHHLENCSLRFE